MDSTIYQTNVHSLMNYASLSMIVFNHEMNILYSSRNTDSSLLDNIRIQLRLYSLTENVDSTFILDLKEVLTHNTTRHGILLLANDSEVKELEYSIYSSRCPIHGVTMAKAYCRDVVRSLDQTAPLQTVSSKLMYHFESYPQPLAICAIKTGHIIKMNPEYIKHFAAQANEEPPVIFCWSAFQKFKKTFRSSLYWHSFPYSVKLKNGHVLAGNFSISPVSFESETQYLFRYCIYSDLSSVNLVNADDAYENFNGQYSRLLAGLGHEVGNVLTVLSGNLQMLYQQNVFKDHPEEYRSMKAELERSIQLAADIRHLSHRPQNRTITYLQEIVDSLRSIMIQHAASRLMEIDFHYDDTPAVCVDENDIRQIVLNLFKNAYESMEIGGRIAIGIFRSSSEVLLTVRDQGPGIHPSVAHQICTPYITTKEGGTGLGLPICLEKVEANGGRINWESGSSGTCFYIYFPAHTDLNNPPDDIFRGSEPE